MTQAADCLHGLLLRLTGCHDRLRMSCRPMHMHVLHVVVHVHTHMQLSVFNSFYFHSGC